MSVRASMRGIVFASAALLEAAVRATSHTAFVANEQDLWDLIADWGNTGSDVRLLVPAGRVLSLRDVLPKNAQALHGRVPFSAGTLTIAPVSGTKTKTPTVLDMDGHECLCLQHNACVPLAGTARLVLVNVTVRAGKRYGKDTGHAHATQLCQGYIPEHALEVAQAAEGWVNQPRKVLSTNASSLDNSTGSTSGEVACGGVNTTAVAGAVTGGVVMLLAGLAAGFVQWQRVRRLANRVHELETLLEKHAVSSFHDNPIALQSSTHSSPTPGTPVIVHADELAPVTPDEFTVKSPSPDMDSRLPAPCTLPPVALRTVADILSRPNFQRTLPYQELDTLDVQQLEVFCSEHVLVRTHNLLAIDSTPVSPLRNKFTVKSPSPDMDSRLPAPCTLPPVALRTVADILSRPNFQRTLPYQELDTLDVQQLEVFCSEHVLVRTHNLLAIDSTPVSPLRNKVTLTFPNVLTKRVQEAATHGALSPMSGETHANSSPASVASAPASGPAAGARLAPAVASIRLQHTSSSRLPAAFSESGLTVVSSQSSSPPTPKERVGQLMQQLNGDMNKVEVHGLLGQGTWGTVYSGCWRGLDVALKTMLFEVRDDQWAAINTRGSAVKGSGQQALFEAAVAASVDHANVVRTYYYDIVPVSHGKAALEPAPDSTQIYKLFLVQSLVASNGMALSAAIVSRLTQKRLEERCQVSLVHALEEHVLHDTDGRLREPSVLYALLVDMARGLEYLHGRNIVHGDLKPANVLLAPCAEVASGVIAKLADFGLSAQLAAGASHISDYCGGTPFYVAPEIVHDHQTSPASDIFSFGIIMWEVYTGETPYLSAADESFAWNPKCTQFPDDNRPPEAYIKLMRRCMVRDPLERPSATQLIEALDAILDSSP